ncbi:MAG TPA: hypothetical protein VGI10_02590 [Polyangiaceae bacterium]
MRLLEPPSTDGLKASLAREYALAAEDTSELAQRRLIAALNERLSDVALELELLVPTYAALTRVALGVGSTLSLSTFLLEPSADLIERARWMIATAASGAVGAAVTVNFGQVAKARAKSIREKWDRVSAALAGGGASGSARVRPS